MLLTHCCRDLLFGPLSQPDQVSNQAEIFLHHRQWLLRTHLLASQPKEASHQPQFSFQKEVLSVSLVSLVLWRWRLIPTMHIWIRWSVRAGSSILGALRFVLRVRQHGVSGSVLISGLPYWGTDQGWGVCFVPQQKSFCIATMCFPSNVQFFASRSFVVCVWGTTKQWSIWSLKERRPTMRRVSRTHRVALDWLLDRTNLDSKIQIKYIDTKNQLADILTKGNFTRDEWNHLLCLFNISHFSSTVCSETMAKRSQHDSGEERVTAKSRPMMSLIARYRRTYHPRLEWKSSRLLFSCAIHGKASPQQASFSKWDYDDRARSSQEWNTEIRTYDRSGRPDKTSWRMIRKVRPWFLSRG